MGEARYEQIGLGGFILAGLVFIAVGLRDGDVMVLAGSVIWTLSCLLWLVPHMRLRQASGEVSTRSNEGSDDG